MPIYEYRCSACGHELDALQKVGDDPLRQCPGCGKPSLRRLISAPAFRLKGNGWYETDFKSDKEVKRNLVESPERAKGGDKKGEKDGKTSGEKGSKPAGDSKSGSSGPSSATKSTGPGSAAA